VDYRNPRPRQRVARLLIEIALAKGWSPATTRGELSLLNGFHLMRAHSADLESTLAMTTP
jgi:hypothetical protein